MKLKDFDLAAPHLPSDSEFRYHIRCIMSLFRRHCQGVITPDTWKVLVLCVPTVSQKDLRVVGGVIDAEIPVTEDLSNFTRLPDLMKRQKALEYLMRGLEHVTAVRGWPIAPFLRARDQVAVLNYQNTWVLSKRQPAGALRGDLSCVHDCEQFKATLSIKDKTGRVLASTIALLTKPDELHFGYKIGDLKWSRNELRLMDKVGSQVASLSVPET